MATQPDKVNRLAHRLIDGVLVFLTFLVHQPIMLNSICPDGYLFPDCSEPCPRGFYGLNCSSSCPGTCLNYRCHASSGNCFQCRPGLRGPTCSDHCATGRFGKDCAQKCPVTCVMKTCSPFTGFCLRCLDGFTGKRCQFPSHKADLEARGRKAETDESQSKENQILMISLTILALLIIPACVVVVVIPRLREKIKKRKMRLRREAFLRKQLSEAMSESKFSSGENSSDQFGGRPVASVSEISEALPIMLRLRNGLSEMLAGRRSSLERRKHTPIYNPTRSLRHRGERSGVKSSSSFDFASLGKSVKKSDLMQHNRIKRLVARKDSPIVLSTTPFHVPRHSKSKSQAAAKSVLEDNVDTNARRKLELDLDLGGSSAMNHRRLYFKTMPSKRVEELERSPRTDSKTGMKKETDVHRTPSVNSISSENEDSSREVSRRDGGEEARGTLREGRRGRLSTTSIQMDVPKSSSSDEPKILQKKWSNIRVFNSLQENLSDAKKPCSTQVGSDWSILGDSKPCTLGVAVEQPAFSPYQSTTYPISRRIHSPYSILTHIDSVTGFGRIVNAFLGYFYRSKYSQRPRASLTIKDVEECRPDNSKLDDRHPMPGKALLDLHDINPSQRENDEPGDRPSSIVLETGICITKDTVNRYQDRIHETSTHPKTPDASRRTCLSPAKVNMASNRTKVSRYHEKEGVKHSLSAQRVNSHAGFSYPPECTAERDYRNEGSFDCVSALKEDNISSQGEVCELCSDNEKVDMPFCARRTNRMFLTIESSQPSNDMFLKFHSQFSNDRQMPLESGMKDFSNTYLDTYNSRHQNVEIGKTRDGNTEGEDTHITLSERPLQEKTLARTSSYQKTDDTCFSQSDESSFQKKREGRHPIKQSIWENDSAQRHMESQRLYQISRDFILPSESLENISDSSDLLSINCNQPIITRTGNSYRVRREGSVTLDDRFLNIYQRYEFPPWEMPCNQPQPPESFLPETTLHSTIPPINTGTEIIEPPPDFRLTSIDRKTKPTHTDGKLEPPGLPPKLVSPLPQEQPLIHFSMKPASVKATDFYLGKSPRTPKETSHTTIDTFHHTKHEKNKGRKGRETHRPSKSMLTKSTPIPQDDHAKRADGVKGGICSYDKHDFAPSNKSTHDGGESPCSLRPSQFFGKHPSKHLQEKQVKNFEKPDPPLETKDKLGLPEKYASLEKRANKNQRRYSAESRQQGGDRSPQKTTVATSVSGKRSYHEVPENENETWCSSIPDSKIVQGNSEPEIIANQVSPEDSLHPSTPSDDNAIASVPVIRSQRSILHGDDGSPRRDTGNASWRETNSMLSEESHGMVANTMKDSVDDSKDTTKKTLIRSESEQLKSRQSEETGDTRDVSQKLSKYATSRKESGAIENAGSELTTNASVGSQLKIVNLQNECPELMRESVSVRDSEEHTNDETKSLQKRSFIYPTPSLLETWFSPTHLFQRDDCSLLNIGTSLKGDILTGIQKIVHCNRDMSSGSTEYADGYTGDITKTEQSCANSPLDGGASVDEEASYMAQLEHELVKCAEEDKDDSDSEEFQDALSMRSFVCKSREAMVGFEAYQAKRTSQTKATASMSMCTSSSAESLCDPIDTLDYGWENNDKGRHSTGNLYANPIESSCATKAEEIGNPEYESKARAQEDGSTFSQTSCEHKTYTVKPEDTGHPTIEHDSARGKESVELQKASNASFYEQRNFHLTSKKSLNFKQKQTDTNLQTKQKEAAEPCLQTKTKRNRQRHKDDLKLGLNSTSKTKSAKTFQTWSNEEIVKDNGNQKRKLKKEQCIADMGSLGSTKIKGRLSDSSLDQQLRNTKGNDSVSRQRSATKEKSAKGPKEAQDKKTTFSVSLAPDVKNGRESSLVSCEKHKNPRDESTSRKRAHSVSLGHFKRAEPMGNRVLDFAKESYQKSKSTRPISPPPRRDTKSPTYSFQRALSETRQARRQAYESRPQSRVSSNESSKKCISGRKSHDKCIAFFKNTSEIERLTPSPSLSLTELFYDVTDQ